MNATYLIPECNLPELEVRVSKLNKRAAKLGLAPITVAKTIDHVKARLEVLTVDGHVNGRVWDLPENIPARAAKWPTKDTGERMAWWKVEVTGEKPSLNGWSFIAVLEPLETEDGAVLNLVSALPGESCPAEYREIIGRCDHCHTNRRRTATFVVRHEDGSTKCVGRNCLKDFLGYHADPHTLAGAAELLAELGALCESAGDDEWLGGGGWYGDRNWDMKRWLTTAAARIRLFGWVSRGKSREDEMAGIRTLATADVVLKIYTPPNPTNHEAVKLHEELLAAHPESEADAKTAEEAVEWAKVIPEGERNDYLANVNLVARVGTVSRKTAGIAASILVAHARAVGREIERAKMAARPESNWIGEKGKRIAYLKVTCDKVIMRETDFGITGIHKLHDEAGNDLVWFASAGAVIKEGESVWIAGTVKGHNEFRGRKETALSRVNVLTDEFVVGLKEKEAKKAERAAKKAAKANNTTV